MEWFSAKAFTGGTTIGISFIINIIILLSSNINCVHVPSGLGQTQATFDIAMGQVDWQL